ncbi:hypothetical protein LEP1GSC087_3445 [Leptospira interrogans serovar Bataviae str. L1111]|nr:hypothetical protein LEP1GSC087_3445 [Leptospira interrogans serovar Bataviae str. L1111]
MVIRTYKVVPENEWVILQRFRILKKLYLEHVPKPENVGTNTKI